MVKDQREIRLQSPEQVEVAEPAIEQSEGFRVEQPKVEQVEAPVPQEVAEAPTRAPAPVVEAPAAPAKPEDIIATESLLATGLDDLYLAMDQPHRAAFKQKGEEITLAIKQLADSGKLTASKVLGLIRGWLELIPGVNKFFLEQEAKIKTDTVMDYYRDKSQGL